MAKNNLLAHTKSIIVYYQRTTTWLVHLVC